MGAIRVVFVGVATSALILGCGSKKPAKKPVAPVVTKPTPPPPPPETEADREAKRLKAAQAILPEGSSCLPMSFKSGSPRLELGAVDGAAMLCAFDKTIGPVGCMKLDLATSALAYVGPKPIPGLGFDVKLDGHCARGFCLPDDQPVPGDGVAHMTWSFDGSKVAVLAGDKVHVFAADSKQHASEFSIRADKGVTGDASAIHWVGEAIFVEGGDPAAHGVWVFKPDGTATGPIEVLGGKAAPLLLKGGSFSILDKARVAFAEQGLSTLTTYEVDSGKRAKAVRKTTKAPCKPDELEAYWKDAGSVADAKCKDALDKQFGYFVGATGIAGSKNLLFVLRGSRLGELAVVDPKTLAEQKKVIKLPFCEGDQKQ